MCVAIYACMEWWKLILCNQRRTSHISYLCGFGQTSCSSCLSKSGQGRERSGMERHRNGGRYHLLGRRCHATWRRRQAHEKGLTPSPYIRMLTLGKPLRSCDDWTRCMSVEKNLHCRVLEVLLRSLSSMIAEIWVGACRKSDNAGG